jgi:hypothetical protein
MSVALSSKEQVEMSLTRKALSTSVLDNSGTLVTYEAVAEDKVLTVLRNNKISAVEYRPNSSAWSVEEFVIQRLFDLF